MSPSPGISANTVGYEIRSTLQPDVQVNNDIRNLLNKMAPIDRLDRSFKTDNTKLLERLDSDNLSAVDELLIRMKLDYARNWTKQWTSFFTELKELTRAGVFSCCMIRSFSSTLDVARATIPDRDKYIEAKKQYRVLRSLLLLIRAQLLASLKGTILNVSINILKVIMETVFDMFSSLMMAMTRALKSQVYKWVQDKVLNNKSTAWMKCLGFGQVVRFTLNLFVNDFGLLRQARTLSMRALASFQERISMDIKNREQTKVIRVIDLLIRVLDGIEDAIDFNIRCTSMGLNGPSNIPGLEITSSLPGATKNDITTKGTPPTGVAQPVVPKTGTKDTVVPNYLESAGTLSGQGVQPLSFPGATSAYGKPVINVSTMFDAENAADLQNFLHHYVGVPMKEAQEIATQTAITNCEQISLEDDTIGLQSLFTSLGINYES